MNPAYLVVGAFALIAWWPDDNVTCYPATTMHDCLEAADAFTVGPSRAGAHNPTAARRAACTTYDRIKNQFPNFRLQTRGCIQGFNCGDQK